MFAVVVSSFLRYHRTVTNGSAAANQTDDDIAVDELMTGFDVSRLHYVATDLATNFIRDTVDSMSDEEFEDYLNYHFAVCERADMVGATHHMLDVFRKTN